MCQVNIPSSVFANHGSKFRFFADLRLQIYGLMFDPSTKDNDGLYKAREDTRGIYLVQKLELGTGDVLFRTKDATGRVEDFNIKAFAHSQYEYVWYKGYNRDRYIWYRPACCDEFWLATATTGIWIILSARPRGRSVFPSAAVPKKVAAKPPRQI